MGCGKLWEKFSSQWENFLCKFLGLFLSTVSTGYHLYHFFSALLLSKRKIEIYIYFFSLVGDCGKGLLWMDFLGFLDFLEFLGFLDFLVNPAYPGT